MTWKQIPGFATFDQLRAVGQIADSSTKPHRKAPAMTSPIRLNELDEQFADKTRPGRVEWRYADGSDPAARAVDGPMTPESRPLHVVSPHVQGRFLVIGWVQRGTRYAPVIHKSDGVTALNDDELDAVTFEMIPNPQETP